MNLGEKIYKLRNLYKMSQGDLAEKLNVSRQSISKWENNTSVPELDKLIQLSEVFQITLDELVKGESVSVETVKNTSDKECSEDIIPEKEEKTEDVKAQVNEEIPSMQSHSQKEYESQFQMNTNNSMSIQKIVGFILLAGGLLSLIMAFVFGSGLAIIGGYLILCGIICLLVKKHAGLVIGWMTFILAMLLAVPFTGVRMFYVLRSGYWRGVTMNHIVGVLMWIVLAMLIFFTYLAILKKRR